MAFSLHSVRRPRHPLARALSLLLGLALLSLLLVFGLVVAGVLLVGGGVLLAWRYWTARRMPRPTAAQRNHPQVLEGEFVVIQSGRTATR
jgi:Flp pilus assembly protein TadB